MSAVEGKVAEDDLIRCRTPDGQLRVLDRTGRIVCDIASDNRIELAGLPPEVSNYMVAQAANCRQPPLRLAIDLPIDALASDDACPAIVALAEFMRPHAIVQITIHFEDPPNDWCGVLSKIRYVRDSLRDARQVIIRLSGHFDVVDDAILAEMLQLGVVIRFAAGWSSRTTSLEVNSVNLDALRTFAEFGYRVPIVWYVHRGNIFEFEKVVDDLLDANYQGGFSLPLVCHSPYYSFAERNAELPDAIEYSRLLVRVYDQYPHFDYDFSPLNELAVIARGGWNKVFDLPVFLRFFLTPDGDVRTFRQSPGLGIGWTNSSAIVSMKYDELRESFFEFVRAAYNWANNRYCGDCRWRYLCGGLDGFDSSHSPSMRELDLTCGHRKLFLEHFVTQRNADFSVKFKPSQFENPIFDDGERNGL